MSNLTESITKGTHLSMAYRIKTGSVHSSSYASMLVESRPFYDVDFTKPDILSSVQHSLKHGSSGNSPCQGVALISQPGQCMKQNSLLERRKVKAHDQQALTPPNLSVSTSFNSGYRRSSNASVLTSSTISTSSPVSSISSAYSTTSFSTPAVAPQPLSSIASSSSTSLASLTSPDGIISGSESKSLGDLEPPRTSLGISNSQMQFSLSDNPFDPELTPSTSGTPYWGFEDQSVVIPRQAQNMISQMYHHQYPVMDYPQQQHYNGPLYYLPPGSGKIHNSSTQAVVPEMYEMARLHMMGQEPLPQAGMSYGSYGNGSNNTSNGGGNSNMSHGHHHHPYGYKNNEMLAASLAQGGYYIRGGQIQRGGLIRAAGRRKSRYNSLNMGIPGMVVAATGDAGYSGHVCAECRVVESPEWRKGPKGPKTLCNACGLRWAKKSRKESQQKKSAVRH